MASDSPSKQAKAEPKRSYSQKTLKVLFAFCGNRCAEPNCTNLMVIDATDASGELVVG